MVERNERILQIRGDEFFWAKIEGESIRIPSEFLKKVDKGTEVWVLTEHNHMAIMDTLKNSLDMSSKLIEENQKLVKEICLLKDTLKCED